MKLLRRFKLVIACLLAVLLVGGTALPSPALWQCRYSAHVVSAAFIPTPSAMPCLMGTMSAMPCCHPASSAIPRSSHGQRLSRPACHPTLTSLAAVPALGLTEVSHSLRQTLIATPSDFPITAAFVVSAPLTLSLRQRPPPAFNLSPSVPAYSFGLCAPPVA